MEDVCTNDNWFDWLDDWIDWLNCCCEVQIENDRSIGVVHHTGIHSSHTFNNMMAFLPHLFFF